MPLSPSIQNSLTKIADVLKGTYKKNDILMQGTFPISARADVINETFRTANVLELDGIFSKAL